jgi:hypothetical protein
MSLFDNIDLQGGLQMDVSLDIDTSLNNMFDSPRTAHAATVSPTDLWNDEAILSTAGSVAFPNLPTPDVEYFDSPDLTSSGFDTTPAFGEDTLDSTLDFNKFQDMPLFTEAEKEFTGEPAIVQSNSFGSLTELSQQTAPYPVSHPSPMVRQKSSPGRPPIVHDRKASLSAGIAKGNQKPRKELPDIVIESEDDKETAKRKKNTAAARKSRQRRQEAMSSMASEINRLRAIVEALGGDPDMELET